MVEEIERYVPELRGRISYEHYHRYFSTRKIVAEKSVLDVACGEGFGVAILAKVANRVVGLDIHQPTVSSATARYQSEKNLEFVVGDCRKLPFEDATFDVVTSFETIEHIEDHDVFIAEVRRVLRRGGLFIVSTPNKETYTDETGHKNPFHLLEFYERDFRDLLQCTFRNVLMHGQRFIVPSAIMPMDEPQLRQQAKPAFYDKAVEDNWASANFSKPQYFVAVCCDGEIPAGLNSLYFDSGDDLWLEYEKLLRWASGVHDETEHLRGLLQQEKSKLNQEVGNSERLLHSSRFIIDEAVKSTMRLGAVVHRIVEESPRDIAKELSTKIASVEEVHLRLSQCQYYGPAVGEAVRELQELQKCIEDQVKVLAGDTDVLTSANKTLAHELEALQSKLTSSGQKVEEIQELNARLETEINFLIAENQRQIQAKQVAEARVSELRVAQDAVLATVNHLKHSSRQLKRDLRDSRRASEKNESKIALLTKVANANELALREVKNSAELVALSQRIREEFTAASTMVRRRLNFLPFHAMIARAQLRHPLSYRPKYLKPTRRMRREIEKCGHFDPIWYLQQNHDVAIQGIDPLSHFMTYGLMEDRDPNPFFSSVWYRANAPEPLGDLPAYAHFIADVRRKAWPQHPLFDANFYVKNQNDLTLSVVEALDHFIQIGASQRRDPHPLVDMVHMSAQGDLSLKENPLLEYLMNPALRDVSCHPLFDTKFYLSQNEDIARADINPYLHYCVFGWRDGRQPHSLFASDWYLANNPDVLEAGINPFEHYLRFGAGEGRRPHPLFEADTYLKSDQVMEVERRHALFDYIRHGAKLEISTTRAVSVENMRSIVADYHWQRHDPITAFVVYGQQTIDVPTHYAVPAAASDRIPHLVWPPTPQPTYWLPQALRDYILARYGEDRVPLYSFLMAVIDRLELSGEMFATSSDATALVDRIRHLASSIEPSEDVEVSIVVPVYNNIAYTLTSLVSILESETRFSFEIIIGDDRSSDATEEIIRSIGYPVKLVRHSENIGFLRNCNTCANVARGRYVVFLNNDTLILPGWLDELIDAFERDPQVGLVGSKLLNSDGTLQEAGGIFWSDGSAWNFGRNCDPSLPEFNYQKDVDYVSGASIALPLDLWRELAGFDPIFNPAYCEDSDLAFRVRNRGRKTVYAPHSEVIHHEGRSHGRDTSEGVKAYQVLNGKTLFNRWQPTLAKQNFPNGEHVFLARDRSRDKPHVLIIDHYVPQWDRDAGSRTMYHFIRMFVERGFQVTLWPDNLHEDLEYSKHLQRMGVEVIYSGKYLNRFMHYIKEYGIYFDYALVSRPHIATKYYQGLISHSKAKILYYGHDIHFRRLEAEMDARGSEALTQEAYEMRLLEFDNWKKAHVVIYPSFEERDIVNATFSGNRAVQVPMLGYNDDELKIGRVNLENFGKRDFDQLIFVGGSHPPNIDAILWFVRDIFPEILSKNPNVKLHIVGSSTADEVRKLASQSIVIRGRLTDSELNELYARSGIAIIPLRFGAGVKGKVIEALFNAIPFVTTSVGMQGLRPESPIGLIEDTAQDFGEAVIEIQTSLAEARMRAINGLSYVDQVYSLSALRDAFTPFVPELALNADNKSKSA